MCVYSFICMFVWGYIYIDRLHVIYISDIQFISASWHTVINLTLIYYINTEIKSSETFVSLALL